MIYISGKITGLDIRVAREMFDAAESNLKANGMQPINPMAIIPYNETWSWEHYMIEDIKLIFSCRALLMLPNWTDSKGARIERAIAHEMGLNIYYSISEIPNNLDHSHIIQPDIID